MSTIAKFLSKPPDVFSTQIATPSVGTTDLSVQLDSTSGLPTEGVGQFFKKDASGNLVAGSVEFVHWTNVSGNTITFSNTGDRGITGSDSGAQAYVADDYFEVWASSYYVGGYGGTVEHNSDGTHDNTKVAMLTATQTFTNKTITKRVVTTTDDATSVIDCTITDVYELTAVANATTFSITGTPINGQSILIRFKDAGVAKGLTWTGITALGVTLPTTTVASKWHYVGIAYNLAATAWHALAVGVEA